MYIVDTTIWQKSFGLCNNFQTYPYISSRLNDYNLQFREAKIRTRVSVRDTQQPILIVGGEHVVMKQGADLLDKPSIVYKTESVIRGVAIHVASAQLFVSTSSGYVKRTSLVEPSAPDIILSPERMNFKPLTLSVDWLNLHLYVLGEVKHMTTVWQITRCNLDGRGLTVAMAGLITKPSHIEVDPYNGYLFWVTRSGLYRLDLADISNGVKHEVYRFAFAYFISYERVNALSKHCFVVFKVLLK